MNLTVQSGLIEQGKEIMACYKDPFYFATHYCYTQKAEEEGRLIELYPSWHYLESIMAELAAAKGDHLWPKSRQMLLTWTFAIHELHRITFLEGYSALNISRKEALVDDGGEHSTINSIHGRIRFIHGKLPDWLKAPLRFSYLKIVNQEPGMEGLIVGESANPDAGRAGSYIDIFVDEFASIQADEYVHTALSGCTYRTRHYVSTVKRGDNTFNRLLDQDTSGFIKHKIHWRNRPDRNDAWYNRKIAGMKGWQVQQELEINPHGSAEELIFPEFSRAHVVVGDDRIPTKYLAKIGGQDWGYIHPAVLLEGMVDLEGNVWVLKEEVEAKRQVLTIENGLPTEDCWVGVAKKRKLHLIVAGHERPENVEVFQQNGINCQHKVWDFQKGVQEISKLLTGTEGAHLYIHESCETLIETLPVQAWKRDKQGNVLEKAEGKNDHACFPAGTPVATPKGEMPIEHLKPGDLVITRSGTSPVLDAKCTDQAASVHAMALSNGLQCVSTLDHPYWVKDKGFVAMKDLTHRDKLLIYNPKQPLILEQAHMKARPWLYAKSVPVYNLRIEAGEYFANGVLVSNCDALRYLVEAAQEYRDQEAWVAELEPHPELNVRR